MKVKQVFRGVPKGEFYPVTYKPGDTVPAELVSAAKAVGADQEAPERPASEPIVPQSVSQMGPNGAVGRSGKSKAGAKGAAKSADDDKGAEDGAGAEGGDGAEGAEAAEGADGAEGAEGAGAGEGKDASDGETKPAPSGEPNLGGLG